MRHLWLALAILAASCHRLEARQLQQTAVEVSTVEEFRAAVDSQATNIRFVASFSLDSATFPGAPSISQCTSTP